MGRELSRLIIQHKQVRYSLLFSLMSWRQPRDLFGPGADDQLMMQEILDLLATDSSNCSPERTISTAASSSTDRSNHHGSIGTEFNRSFANGSSINEPLNDEMKNIVKLSSADDAGSVEAWGYAIGETSSESSNFRIEDIPLAGQGAAQQRTDSAVDLVEQTPMQNSMYAAPCCLTCYMQHPDSMLMLAKTF